MDRSARCNRTERACAQDRARAERAEQECERLRELLTFATSAEVKALEQERDATRADLAERDRDLASAIEMRAAADGMRDTARARVAVLEKALRGLVALHTGEPIAAVSTWDDAFDAARAALEAKP